MGLILCDPFFFWGKKKGKERRLNARVRNVLVWIENRNSTAWVKRGVNPSHLMKSILLKAWQDYDHSNQYKKCCILRLLRWEISPLISYCGVSLNKDLCYRNVLGWDQQNFLLFLPFTITVLSSSIKVFSSLKACFERKYSGTLDIWNRHGDRSFNCSTFLRKVT